jgi:hypothetical protein
LVGRGRAPTTINRNVARVRHVFRWAVAEELVPPSVDHGLIAVEGLRRGRDDVRETEPVGPVPAAAVEQTLPHLSPTLAAMVKLQLLTGMRPGEVCSMRTCDVDTTGDVWSYTPAKHKTRHLGKSRKVWIGPRARDVLAPLLKLDTLAPIFCPAEAEAARQAARAETRRTPVTCGNGPGINRKAAPKRRPGVRYTVRAYAHAVARACDKAFPPPDHLARAAAPGRGRRRKPRLETVAEWRERLGPGRWADLLKWQADHRWHPNQCRHANATQTRGQFGLDAAQAVLGHEKMDTTQVYAEKSAALARRVAAEMG